ncbi:MAG TPA: hypothetical protein VHA35_10660 [Dongiaceae bacterium]|jgi:hypothetical protein|nr:hypothetical protein [Dongiaceae bacterium]
MSKDKSKAASPEDLVKSSPTAPVELSETDLEKVSGGRKAGGDQQEFLKIKLTDVLISG